MDKRDEIERIAASYGAFNIRVLGSIVRREATVKNDTNFLVDVGPQTSSWFPAGLVLDLQNLLGHPVDIVTEKGLNPYIRDYVLKEAVAL